MIEEVKGPEKQIDSQGSPSTLPQHATRADLLSIMASLASIEAKMQEYPSLNPLDSKENHTAILRAKQASAELLGKIWGGKENHAVFAANTLQHVALFCIPAVTASAHMMQRTRYRDDAKFSSESSRTANMLAKAVLQEGRESPSEDFSTFAIAHHHLPSEDRKQWDVSPKTVHQKPVHHKHGIPHCVMAYSLYESLRAAEFIAEHRGQVLTPDEREIHYKYFAEILQRSGYRCPSDRKDMEAIAQQIDGIAGTTPMAKDMIQRALQHLNTYDEEHAAHERAYPPRTSLSIPPEWVREFLRPHSQRAFDGSMKDTGG
ncbi:MAG: hypothetical protein HOO67_01450 [Candidatus Peribacteraceae bacterium]|nr:hypothetical protein [Candidatus Peribacteraceae bacterium]